MERNLTRAALDTVLGQRTDLAPLAGKLAEGVDSDLLISLLEALGLPKNPAALGDAPKVLAASFVEAKVGDLSKLALAIFIFLQEEVAAGKRTKKGEKQDRDEEKQRKLLKAIAKEAEAKVKPGVITAVMEAHQAAAAVDTDGNRQKKREHFEANGVEFKITIPSPGGMLDQVQYKYYVVHKAALLDKIGFDCIKSEKVPGEKCEETLKVPGSFMKTLFENREKAHQDLRIVPGLAQPKIGPYGSAQFMAWVAAERRNDLKESKKAAAKKSPETLEKEKATEIGTVTAKAATLIDSARTTLKARLLDEEDAKKKPVEARDAAVKEAAEAAARARSVVNAEELKAREAIEEVEAKWTLLIEEATAVKVKADELEKAANEKQQKALKRRSDLTAQAERRVQSDTIANASKRVRATGAAEAGDEAAIGGTADLRTIFTPVADVAAVATAAAPAPIEETDEGRAEVVARVAAEEAVAPAAVAPAVDAADLFL